MSCLNLIVRITLSDDQVIYNNPSILIFILYFLQRQTMRMIILYLCLLFQISYSSGVSYNANSKYAYVGRTIVNMANEVQLLNYTNWSTDTNPPLITITFPPNFNANNNSKISFTPCIAEFDTVDLSNGLDIYTFQKIRTMTQAGIQIFTRNASIIQKLTISYLLLANYYFNYIGIYTNLRSFSQRNLISSTPSSFLIFNVPINPPINPNGTIKIPIMMGGITASSNSTLNIIDVSLSAQLADSSVVQITISSTSAATTYLYEIYLTFIVYNQDFINSDSSIYRFYSGTITVNSGTFGQLNSTYQMTDLNTFVGLSSFSNSKNTFSFYVSVNQSNGIVITSSNSFSSAFSLTFAYFLIQSYYCQYKNPFLETDSQLCYSICPASMAADNATLSCLHDLTSTQSSIGIIVGVTVGTLVIIAIIFFIVRRYSKKQQNQQSDIKEAIQFEGPILSNQDIMPSAGFIETSPQKSKPQTETEYMKGQSQNEVDVEIPIYRRSTQIKKLHQKENSNQEKPQEVHSYPKIRKSKEQWYAAQKLHSSSQTCCICLMKHTFLQSACSHNFHFTCLSKWRNKSSTCPLCKREPLQQYKYFCNVCRKKYRIVKLGTVPFAEEDFQRICSECREIPI